MLFWFYLHFENAFGIKYMLFWSYLHFKNVFDIKYMLFWFYLHFENVFDIKYMLFWFYLHFETFLHPGRIQRDFVNVLISSFRVPDILTKLEFFFRYVLLKASSIKCHESTSRGSQAVPREQTVKDDVKGLFSQLWEHAQSTFQSPVVIISPACCNIHEVCILRMQCIFAFTIILSISSITNVTSFTSWSF